MNSIYSIASRTHKLCSFACEFAYLHRLRLLPNTGKKILIYESYKQDGRTIKVKSMLACWKGNNYDVCTRERRGSVWVVVEGWKGSKRTVNQMSETTQRQPGVPCVSHRKRQIGSVSHLPTSNNRGPTGPHLCS